MPPPPSGLTRTSQGGASRFAQNNAVCGGKAYCVAQSPDDQFNPPTVLRIGLSTPEVESRALDIIEAAGLLFMQCER